MEKENETPVKEVWVKPELNALPIAESTLGLGGGGPDFGSELS